MAFIHGKTTALRAGMALSITALAGGMELTAMVQ